MYNTVQFSTVQCSAVEYSSHNSSVQCSAVFPVIGDFPQDMRADLDLTWEIHFTALYATALHCTALHCTALHCTALH